MFWYEKPNSENFLAFELINIPMGIAVQPHDQFEILNHTRNKSQTFFQLSLRLNVCTINLKKQLHQENLLCKQSLRFYNIIFGVVQYTAPPGFSI